MTWTSFAKTTLASIAALIALLFAFVLVMNPFGSLPQIAFSQHVIMDVNQRFQYPAVARSRQFQSAVFGTSTSRLLDPADLEASFPGRFANLAMNDGRAWEQWRLLRVFLEAVETPRTVLIGIDTVWCRHYADAPSERVTGRGFPEWMFDANPWNDVLYAFNAKAVEISFRQLAYRTGFYDARIPFNGFELFTPPNSEYDLERVRAKLYAGQRASTAGPDRRPALAWLRDGLERMPHDTLKLLVLMPVHIQAQPLPDSPAAASEANCKAEIAEIAAATGAHAVDLRIESKLTRDDSNYWDALHWRVELGAQIIAATKAAIDTGQDDPDGRWRYLAGPARER